MLVVRRQNILSAITHFTLQRQCTLSSKMGSIRAQFEFFPSLHLYQQLSP